MRFRHCGLVALKTVARLRIVTAKGCVCAACQFIAEAEGQAIDSARSISAHWSRCGFLTFALGNKAVDLERPAVAAVVFGLFRRRSARRRIALCRQIAVDLGHRSAVEPHLVDMVGGRLVFRRRLVAHLPAGDLLKSAHIADNRLFHAVGVRKGFQVDRCVAFVRTAARLISKSANMALLVIFGHVVTERIGGIRADNTGRIKAVSNRIGNVALALQIVCAAKALGLFEHLLTQAKAC